MGELVIRIDAESLKILERIGLDKKDDFINRAIKAYATSGGAFEYAAGKDSSGSSSGLSLTAGLAAELGGAKNASSPGASDPASQLNSELERLLGHSSAVTAALASGNPQMVDFFQGGSKIASLELSECQSILKSLRPPISLAEVVEMLTLMSVG